MNTVKSDQVHQENCCDNHAPVRLDEIDCTWTASVCRVGFALGGTCFLFYGTIGEWMIGSDTSQAVGSWAVRSTARTPDRITETWQESDGAGTWPRVTGAKVVRATAAARA